jgi:hypothetical protein
VITLAAWIWGLFTRENLVASQYRKSRPGFIFYLAVDAIFSGILVFAGYQFIVPNEWASHENFMVAHPGFMPSQVDSLLDFIEREPEHIYWIGKSPHYHYRFRGVKNYEASIQYLPNSAGPAIVPQVKITVYTYRNPAAFSLDIHPALNALSEFVTTAGGITGKVKIGARHTFEEVILQGRHEIMTIGYSEPQSPATLMHYASIVQVLR